MKEEPGTADGTREHQNGSGNGSLRAPEWYLIKSLEDAEHMLAYAAEAGIEIENQTRDAVLNARTVPQDQWSQNTAANVLTALTTLAGKLKPVTADGLRICADDKAIKDTIKTYKKIAIWLAIFIIPFSLLTFITSGISKAISTDIEKANVLAVKLGDELRSTRELNSTPGAQRRSQIVPRDLQEFTAIMRSIDTRAWQLNLYALYSIQAPFGRTWRDYWANNRDKVREYFEIKPGDADNPDVASAKISAYQEVRSFAETVGDTVSTAYGAIATCILPVLYALLGACAYLLRSFEEKFKLRTFNPNDVHLARFLIAAIGGAVCGLFNNFNLNEMVSIPPLAIAFLVGYAVDVFFSFLERLLQNFARRSDAAPDAKQGTTTSK